MTNPYKSHPCTPVVSNPQYGRCGYCEGCRKTAQNFSRANPIAERIEKTIEAHGGICNYHQLAVGVFPPEIMAKSWNYSSNGGPPGCYMALSRAINRYGFMEQYRGPARIRMVYGHRRNQ